MTGLIERILSSSVENKEPQGLPVKILRQSLKVACALAIVALAVSRGYADTPASQVYQQTVQPTQTYPEVAANGEGWFDVGGFCKVVDVGDLSSVTPPASGVPVFVPGPTDQWENYRTSAPTSAGYDGRLTLTTCCRPQSNFANLCTEAGATPVSVSRQYGKLGETDVVRATCVDEWGKQYTDSVSVTCQGDDGPNGQAQWAEVGGDSTSNCTPNANITYGGCSASCGGGNLYETVQNSCGVVTAQGYIGPSCNTQSCCNYVKSGCNGPNEILTDTNGVCPEKQGNGGCTLEVVGYGSCSVNVLNPNSQPPGCGTGTSCLSTCGRYPGDPCGGYTWNSWGTHSGTCTTTATDPGYCADDPNRGATTGYQCVDWQ